MKKIRDYFSVDPLVFYPTATIAILFVLTVILIGEPASVFFNGFQSFMSEKWGWFVTLAINFYLIKIISLAFGKFGGIRLGGKDALPEFSKITWIAMLFSAGMGIGLIYFSIAEPMYHFLNPISSSFS